MARDRSTVPRIPPAVRRVAQLPAPDQRCRRELLHTGRPPDETR
jgi:hypothetical protein